MLIGGGDATGGVKKRGWVGRRWNGMGRRRRGVEGETAKRL